MEPVQILLFSVVILLTILLLLIGFQAFLILREARRAIRRIDALLDDATTLSSAISRPVAGITDLLYALKEFKEAFDILSQKHENNTTVPQQSLENPLGVNQEFKSPSKFSATRYFHRRGKPLTS